jgi:hypothetical protein
MAPKVTGNAPPTVPSSGAAAEPDSTAATASPTAKDTTVADPKKAAGWKPHATSNSQETARTLRLSKTVGTLSSQYQALKATVSGALETSEPVVQQLLKELPPEQAELVMDAAKEAAGEKVAAKLMTSATVPWTQFRYMFSPARQALAMEEVNAKALGEGEKAAAKFLTKYVKPDEAEQLAKSISKSNVTTEALAKATKGGSVLKVVGVAAHGLTGLLTVYDLSKAVKVQRDSTATKTQKVAGWVTAAADAAMFIPYPPLELAAAAVSVAGAFLRDSKHPVQDLEDDIQHLGSLVNFASPSAEPAQ